MILKIILLIIIFHLCLEGFRKTLEGMDDKPFDIEYPDLDIECEIDLNVKYPAYNREKNTYSNKNNYLFNNRENIIKSANTSC